MIVLVASYHNFYFMPAPPAHTFSAFAVLSFLTYRRGWNHPRKFNSLKLIPGRVPGWNPCSLSISCSLSLAAQEGQRPGTLFICSPPDTYPFLLLLYGSGFSRCLFRALSPCGPPKELPPLFSPAGLKAGTSGDTFPPVLPVNPPAF